MKSPRWADLAFLTFTAVLIAATATGGALLWPAVVAAAHGQASGLVTAGHGAPNAREAQIDYTLAVWLDPSNVAARLGLAQTQIAAGQADAALVTLEPAGEGSEAAQLRLRTLAELGRYTDAADRAASLGQAGRSDTDLVLAGLIYALDGRPADTAALVPLVASPQAAQSLSRAGAGELPMAAELYVAGLPDSARRILVMLPASFERNLLLARILYARHTADDLTLATTYLKAAVALKPSDAQAHQFLAALYAEQNNPIESQRQSDLASKITSGRP